MIEARGDRAGFLPQQQARREARVDVAPGDPAEPTRAVLARRPVNAWLLVGDEASYPTSHDLRLMRKPAVATDTWTAPSQAQPGDLLLFYFMAPRKEIRFAARAASHPFFDSSVGVNSLKAIDPHQWWITHTPLVEVPALTFSDLKKAMGGSLILKGKPRHYLSPEVVRKLFSEMRNRDTVAVLAKNAAAVLQVPTGDPDLPDPAVVQLAEWSRMADGALRLEAQVERYVVAPLIRMALHGRAETATQPQCQVSGAGVADWVVLRSGVAAGVVESKVGIAEPRTGRWDASPEFAQLRRYMDRLQVSGLLIDSKRMFLVDRGASAPTRVLSRAGMTFDEMRDVGRHLAG